MQSGTSWVLQRGFVIVVASTTSEALRMVLEKYPDLDTASWDVEEVDTSKPYVDEILEEEYG